MKKKFILLPLVGILLYVLLSSYSEGPAYWGGVEGTGATGNAGCSCHNPTASPATTVQIQLYDVTGTTLITGGYVGGTAYKIKISGTQTNLALTYFGFQMAVVQASGAGTGSAVNAGVMSAAPTGTHIDNSTGIDIFEHYNGGLRAAIPGTLVGSTETYSETITWTAPAAGTGSVVVYGTINAVNHDGAAGSPDTWNSTSLTINEAVSVGPITGTTTVCAGSNTPLSDITTGGTWTCSNTTIATVVLSGVGAGVVHGVSSGTAVISYIASSGTATTSVVVNPLPIAGTITGPSTVCTGSIIHLTDASTGGVWSSSNTSFATVTATGDVKGVAAGSVNISYSVTNSCGTLVASVPVTINPLPVAGTITGPSTVCAGSIIHLTDASTGGVWSSSNTSFATVTTTGDVQSISAGSLNISYSVTNGCGTAVISSPLTVNALPVAGTITGPPTVCAGSIIHLTDASTGGVWSSSNTSFATVTATGDVKGVAAGSVNISYSVTNTCSTVVATAPVTINPLPVAGTISGPSTVCAGVIIHLTDASSGGVWSSSNTSFATVTATGDVQSISAGSVNISYSVTNGCGTVVATAPVTVNPLPDPGTIIDGAASVCAGSGITFSDASAGGVWISSNTSIATVTAVGAVSGVSAGGVTISYSVTNGCGTAVASVPVTVNPLPVAGTITGGAASVCAGTIISFSDASGGGVWSSSNTSFATVTATGNVKGVSAGSVNISYSVTNGCGTVEVNVPVTVNPLPDAGTIIGGAASVCELSSIVFSDASGGGVWSSSNTSFATVTSTGTVNGVSAGSVNISYSVTNGCGTVVTSVPVTVNPRPVAGTITGGAATVCAGAGINFSDASPGGVWSSSNTSFATVTSTGGVSGVSAGTVSIIYTVTNGCGTVVTSAPVTVNPAPVAGTISGGAASVCEGAAILFSDASVGGIWSSSNTSFATVTAGGFVNGVSGGSVNISYSVTNGCGTAVTSVPVTVNPLPVAGTLTSGSSIICTGATTTFSDASPGGVWSSSNTAVATVSSGGVVNGLTVGSVVISYSVTNTCGTVRATTAVSVTLTASAGTITGSSSVCAGSNIPLSDGVTGGTWSSTNTSAATISSGGVVTGIASGVTTISYTISGSCGAAATSAVITVNPIAVAGTISGATSVCQGSSIPLSDGTGGGVWSSSNTALATVSAGGSVGGVSAGSPVISYTVTNSCGPVSAIYPVTVNPLPVAGTITGATTVCVSSAIHLSDGIAGGVWSSGSTAIATVDVVGTVHGVSAGSATISYTVTNSCGAASATYTVTIDAPLSVNPITGAPTVCQGSITHLTDATTGGVWSSSNTSFATVTGTGDVTGVSAGSLNISYSVANSCGAVSATVTVTVNPLPIAGAITGPSTVCGGSTSRLTDASTGGVWSSSNTSFATVTGTGDVSGISAGGVNISYSVTNGCGTVVASVPVTVNPLPLAGTITGGAASVCAGSVIIFSDAAASGAWSSSNTSFATVIPSGAGSGTVQGVSSGSVNISYSVTNGCGTVVASVPVTVNPLAVAGTITGAVSSVCAGSAISFSDAAGGGVWSSSNTSFATVTATGNVSGISAGSVTISYSVTNGCGTVVASVPVTVNPLPVAGTITGASSVCTSAFISLSDPSAGGVWISSNTSFASVTSAGVVSGVSAGAVIITYSVTNSCGTVITSVPVTVNPSPVAGTITGGATAVCAGSVMSFSDAVSGGVWTSSNTSFATVTSTGDVNGVSAGAVTISYSVTNGCGTATATVPVTVNPLPVAGAITGPSSVCAGAVIHLSDAASGGVWSSSNTSFATVTTTGGVNGVSAGSVTISYSVTNGCGTAVTSASVTVNPLPFAGTVTGAATVCAGDSILLSDVVSGGTWSSSNVSFATVLAGGLVRGISAGGVTISYSVTNSCGTVMATLPVTVNPLPAPAAITGGASSVCAGSTITFSDVTTGGVWSSSNASFATVASGIAGGVAAGSVTISYTVTNGCGSGTVTVPVLVNALPATGIITGMDSICLGSTDTLSDAIAGGVWSVTNANAFVSSSGLFIAVSTGFDTVLYTVTNVCGSAHASLRVKILDLSACAALVGSIGNEETGINIYPNPSTGSFTIDMPETPDGATITIMDVLGKIIETRNIKNPAKEKAFFNLNKVAPGSYIVKIEIANKVYRKKIVIW